MQSLQRHPSAPLSVISGGQGPLEKLLQERRLYPVFQPIVNLEGAAVYAHEALIRGPQGTALHTPDALLRAAAEEDLGNKFEYACVVAAMQAWGQLKAPGRLFVNISANALTELHAQHGQSNLSRLISSFGILPRMLVLEITEHERVADMDHLAVVVQQARAAGVSLALDDFGDGRSSLRLWSQLKPEIVKIDKYFTKDISAHGDKLKTIQALQQIASVFGSELVAEGIETADDLRVLRDLGIHYGQGYFLGHPDRQPIKYLGVDALRVLRERQVVVFPELSRSSQGGHLRHVALLPAPSVTETTTNDELATLFLAHEELHAVALLEGERPLGIINRAHFMNEYTKLYYREVWGRKSCAIHANREPRVIERDHSVDELVGILTSQDQRYLSDGFIVTENGRYRGLGTGDQLVRSVTETRIEAARHANPLTFLPGNIPISQHMERLLKKEVRFVACYADLNNFKPFNDHYGYWRGDEMLRLLARIAMEQCDPQRDFLGHVGGDDFILLFQSTDWRVRCEKLVAEFAQRAQTMYDDEARSAGGIEAEDRHGVMRFFPCTTLSIGAVAIDASRYSRAEEVANMAALAKHAAKQAGAGLYESPSS
ncbi:GGDEF domain-containing protein [Rhodoferax saidenbachensis]|uniref:Diguanylate phosphodiesterase n=1 Tax=Rhodoferax saidenbachensis TaxID=1484693 RepID=A0A1P8K8R0_9BURK|nr:phosphodiesterase [Rhodoferax saidenbachensis]APW42369.1 diguanylate phosphodiesterase [Rhodoferax saidenbachensis]